MSNGHEEDIRKYSEAIRQDPDDAVAFLNRGLAYFYKGDYDQAIQDYSEAIRLKPDYALAFRNRGLAYKELGDDAKSKADFLKAEELDAKAKNKP